MTRFLRTAISLSLSAALHSGTIVKSKYSSDGKASHMTVYSSPGSQRVDLGDSRTIQQCASKRMMQFDEKTKTFIVVPEAIKPAVPADTVAGTCQNKPVYLDTGEKERILGLESARWKTTLENCDGSKTEIDGYYAGFEYAVSCELAPVVPNGPPGSPLAYTAVTTTADGKSSTVTYAVESLQLTNGPLEPTFFDLPGEAKETTIIAAQAVRNPDFIEAAGNPKLSGATRIGVATGGEKALLTALSSKC
ncbi:MAG: hypothetical protein R2729_04765 [Bryobacteraceae bacterium]